MKKIIAAISILCLTIFLFLAFKHHYIILNFSSLSPQSSSITAHKKKVALFYWKNEQWHQEEVFLLKSEYAYNNIYQLISHYLQLLTEESIIKQRVIIQKVLINYDNQELFISFDSTPLHKESCTHEKLMVIEGMLKTIKTNEPNIKKVRFLINHQPMTDTHLDFSNAWPVDGFLNF